MPMKQSPYSRKELLAEGPQAIRTGRDLDEIAFPLGGIGTGTVSLGGWGQLRDWEIMNRPAKGRTMPNAFFCVRVQEGRKPPQVKTLQGPAGGSYCAGGHSAGRASGEGLPHFREVAFKGEYPFAELTLKDADFPVEAELVAFNPYIPLNEKDSGIPAAVLTYKLKNKTQRRLKVSVMGNLTNIIGEPEGRLNEPRTGRGLKGLVLSTDEFGEDDAGFGTMALSTPAEGAWVWPQWHGEAHNEGILKFWEAIAWEDKWPPQKRGNSDTGTLGVDIVLKPGETVTIPFIISWHFPNFEHWRKCEGCKTGATWKNWYATVWKDAWDAAAYVRNNLDRLHEETRRFHDALFASTLPAHVLDAVSSQISILKTNTCLRLEDGTFYAFEGCSDAEGCCEGSCTHVWNYAQALPYLFPELQRSMREADWDNSMRRDGSVCFRMPLPLGTKPGTGLHPMDFHPAADGQMGTVMQVYREWQICGDDEWLKRIWPQAQKALEFAWKYWDADKDGVMEGMQHNTADNEFYGPNTMMGSLYLGALRAAEKIATYLGDEEKAAEYGGLVESGSAWSDEHLFNGQYYEQIVNPKAHEAWPAKLRKIAEASGMDDKFKGWPRWQFGKGCLSDQLIGQWYAQMLDLGYLYRRGHVRKTLQSVFRYNWKPDMTDHFCSLRVYAINEEAGLLVATWPLGQRPGHAFWFADEVWCGVEYELASHLIYEGFLEQGLAIVKGVRDRHTGERRNPWDEFECGHHYTRSMASYSVLLALSGFSYSAPEQRIGFAPHLNEKDFTCFFSVGSGWGTYSQERRRGKWTLSIRMEYGHLELAELTAAVGADQKVSASVGRRKATAQVTRTKGGVRCRFEEPVTIHAGETLKVTLSR